MSDIYWTPGMTLEAMEEMIIKKAYNHYQGNKTMTSKSLGISIRTLENKLEKYAEDQIQRDLADEERRKKEHEFFLRQRGIQPPTQPIAVSDPIQVKVKKRI